MILRCLVGNALLWLGATALTQISGCSGSGRIVVDDPIPLTNYRSANATADSFVSAINTVDGLLSFVELYEWETLRSQNPTQEEWFVIWDDLNQRYTAVSLEYIRTIRYWDYYVNDEALAEEYRFQEAGDVAAGFFDGDPYGDDYEEVIPDGNGFFVGVRSGHLYEDEVVSRDVNLLAAEREQRQFYHLASKVSFKFQLSLTRSMELVTMGQKVAQMRGNGEFTEADLSVLTADIERWTGASWNELVDAAMEGGERREKLIDRVAKRVGSTSAGIKGEFLPELFGVHL